VPAGNYTVSIDVPGVPSPNYCIGDVEEGEEITDIEITFDDYNSIAKRVGSHTSILVYPNPTTGELRIKNGELRINGVEIYDVMGKKLLEEKENLTFLRSYDLTVFPKGIYFLKITTENGVVAKKVIKY